MPKNLINLQRRAFLGSMLVSGVAISLPALAQQTAMLKTRQTRQQGAPTEPDRQYDSAVRDAIKKAENFEYDYSDDIFLEQAQFALLKSCLARLSRTQRLVGYANFNLISFDEARRYAQQYSAIGAFTPKESEFIDYLYHADAARYGFLGKKVSTSLTDDIRQAQVYKLRGSGHYLYKGAAQQTYLKMQKTLGPQLQLTSGIRSVVKQLYLFMAKAEKSAGNLSRAARSLAPPGHSFHGIGDFDVGQRGLGAANFTNAFAQTEIYHRLCDLGLISMRYPFANPYGVRHEPWHIKVVKHV
jgi:D-alanyl-D-alanine carboxypeptidase